MKHMAKSPEMGFDEESEKKAQQNNKDLIKQLQQELKAAQEAAKKNGR